MNELMSALKISSFEKILLAYRKAGINLNSCLDGGAGSGSTAKSMLNHITDRSFIYAFEPFPGNHRFFWDCDHRVKLIPVALAERAKKMPFFVPSVVTEDSEWGRRGMAGYSSVGFLKDTDETSANSIMVVCVKADDVVPKDQSVGFIKLDLQGGELNALKGMPRIMSNTYIMWIEYIGKDPLLIDFIIDSGFIVFDTEYFFMGDPTDKAKSLFEVSRERITLSTNATAWFGFKKKPWNNFKEEFKHIQDNMKMVQTDLLCVNKKHLDKFLHAVRFLKSQ